jgi:hypothetical protein
MAIIPNDEQFIGLSPTVNTTERRSALINAESQAYTMQDITDTVFQNIGYTYYSAFMSQDGINNPTLEVLSNTIGITISFTRSSAGAYTANLGLTSSCPLIIGRTTILCNAQGMFSGGPYIYAVPTFILNTGGPNTYLQCNFYAVDASGNQTPYDIAGDPVYFEIRVYP